VTGRATLTYQGERGNGRKGVGALKRGGGGIRSQLEKEQFSVAHLRRSSRKNKRVEQVLSGRRIKKQLMRKRTFREKCGELHRKGGWVARNKGKYFLEGLEERKRYRKLLEHGERGNVQGHVLEEDLDQRKNGRSTFFSGKEIRHRACAKGVQGGAGSPRFRRGRR